MMKPNSSNSPSLLAPGQSHPGQANPGRTNLAHSNPQGPAEPETPTSSFEEPGIGAELIGAIPPWLISLSLHIVAILGLAVFVFNQPEGERAALDFEAQFDEPVTAELLSVEISTEALEADVTASLTSSSDSGFEDQDDTKLRSENPRIVRTGDFASAFQFDSEMIPLGKKAGAGKSDGKDGEGDQGNGDGAATFYGIKAEGETFVYVLDNSGSMAGIRWIQACNELVRSINSLNEKQKFMVVLYNSHTEIMLGQRGRGIQCLTASKENREKVVKWLSRRVPQLDTYPLGSLKVALRVKPDAIFLLSDGEFRDGSLEFLRKANLDVEKQKDLVNRGMYRRATHCRVHTIAFKSYVGAPLLRQIAHENNGTFRYVE